MLGTKILPAILVAVSTIIWLAAEPSFGETAGDMCRTSPGTTAPQGLHWYYHIDRATKQHCWYLSSEGMHVHSLGSVASPAPSQHENTGEQVGTAPSDTVQTKAEQPAATQTAGAEASSPEPVVSEQAALDFAARWPALPKSLDLDTRDPGPSGNGSASESNGSVNERQATNAEAQMSLSSFRVRDQRASSSRRLAAEPAFGSILLACALGTILLLLCREAFRLGGTLHLEIKRRRARTAFLGASDSGSVTVASRDHAFWPTQAPESDGSAEANLSGLSRALRQADVASYSPRSFAPLSYQVTKIPTVRRILRRKYLGRRTHSVSSASSRNYAAV
jgi:hypothetical protein